MAINVGVLLDSADIPAWQYRIIETLLSSTSICPVFLLLERRRKPARDSLGWIYREFQRLDWSRENVHLDALEPISTQRITDGHQVIILKASESLDLTDDTSDLLALNLDVIVALTLAMNVDVLGGCARYGLWFYWHDYGQTMLYDGRTTGFWEVLNRRAHMRCALLVKKPNESEYRIAYETSSAVHTRSYRRTRNEHLWKISHFVLRALKQLISLGPIFLEQCPIASKEIYSISDNTRWRISNRRLLWPVLLFALSELDRKIKRRIYNENWILMLAVADSQPEPDQFKLLFPPGDRFWADPDVVTHEGRQYIFFEDASRQSGKGNISVIEIGDDATVSSASIVLEKDYHLSYPFVFKWNDEYYLIPESAENRTVDLYRFTDFPREIEFIHSLLEGIEAFDSTIHFHEDLYWLFANVRSHPGASSWDELCVYYADSPVSRNWRPHPMNPVISDVRRSRPAGHLFTEDGDIFRPSQDSSHRYGYALNINKIAQLNTERYEEVLWKKTEPNWNGRIVGVHTLNRSRECYTMDALYRFRV